MSTRNKLSFPHTREGFELFKVELEARREEAVAGFSVEKAEKEFLSAYPHAWDKYEADPLWFRERWLDNATCAVDTALDAVKFFLKEKELLQQWEESKEVSPGIREVGFSDGHTSSIDGSYSSWYATSQCAFGEYCHKHSSNAGGWFDVIDRFISSNA